MNIEEKLAKLKTEFSEKKNSHIFLVETNSIEKSTRDIKELIKEYISAGDITKKQIDDDNYLELIIVSPDGTPIKKDAILALQERIKTKPILSDYMFYIIAPADAMNEIASNKLLKTIEEPNTGVIGFLIATNTSTILPTIKSRCEQIELIYPETSSQTMSPEIHEMTKKLIIALENKDHLEYSKIKNQEKITKENILEVEKILKSYYNTACNLTKNDELDLNVVRLIQKNSFQTIIKKTEYINSQINKLTSNMNSDLLLEKIFIELKEVK